MIKCLKTMKSLLDTGKLNFLRKHVNICNYTVTCSVDFGFRTTGKITFKE